MVRRSAVFFFFFFFFFSFSFFFFLLFFFFFFSLSIWTHVVFLFLAVLNGLDLLLRKSRGDFGNELLNGGTSRGVDGVGEGVIEDVTEQGLGVQELLEVVGDVIRKGLEQIICLDKREKEKKGL